MSYLQFLLIVLAPPVLGFTLGTGRARRPPADHAAGDAPGTAGTGMPVGLTVGVSVVACLAVTCTLPWDTGLIHTGDWSYGPGRVSGWVMGVPVEEVGFMLAQSLLVGLWLHHLDRAVEGRLPRWRPAWSASPGTGPGDAPPRSGGDVPPGGRWAGAAAWGGAALAGALLMTWPGGLFLEALLLWAAGPLALQAAVGGDVLRAARPLRLTAVMVPALYLCLTDRAALALGIWRLSPRHTLGLTVLGLPAEEGLFFVLTCTLVVDSLLLLRSPVLQTRLGRCAARLRLAAKPTAAAGSGSAPRRTPMLLTLTQQADPVSPQAPLVEVLPLPYRGHRAVRATDDTDARLGWIPDRNLPTALSRSTSPRTRSAGGVPGRVDAGPTTRRS